MNQHILLDNYSPEADIVVTAICLVIIVLVVFSYISRTRSSTLFLSMVGLVLVAAWLGLKYSQISFPGVVIGMIGLKISAHLHAYTNVYITRRLRRKGR